jgi:hypothetical protein
MNIDLLWSIIVGWCLKLIKVFRGRSVISSSEEGRAFLRNSETKVRPKKDLILCVSET